MKYFAARLLHMALVDDGRPRRRHLHDETVVIVRASNTGAAKKRALALGRQGEHSYLNTYGQAVRWIFVELIDVTEIGTRLDGAEVASRLHDRVSPKPIAFRARGRPR